VSASHAPGVRRQSVRVALAATLVVAVIYAGITAAVVAISTIDLTAQIDQRITQAFGRLPPDGGGSRPPEGGFNPGNEPGRPFGFRVFAWTVQADGTVLAPEGSPELPAELQGVTAPVTAIINGTQVRIAGTTVGTSRVVVAQSLEFVAAAQRTILFGSLLIAPFLLGGVFAGAVLIGRRVAAPIEAARRRQLEFTADASHELRTPLSVIEAHTSLALAQERDAAWYRGAFARVDREARRMRRLLEDMLWLARFDASATPKATESVDLVTLARQSADRFGVIAETRHLALVVRGPEDPVIVAAGPELLDRLIGVLVDNACKYAPETGRVEVTVATDAAGRATLTVDDSGPGIPDEDRERIFDRFHRAVVTSSEAAGAGLGLAIGDAIVHATGGRWAVATSPLGGARFTVSWPRATLGG
jgi:signal transduction histidine kinase